MKAWVNDLNTTNFRIVVSIALTAFAVFIVFIGIALFHWEPTDKQVTVLEGIALVLLTMMGFDVVQFIGKRQTDAALAAAKNPNQPVQATVTTERTTDAAIAIPSATTVKTADPLTPIGESVPGEGD